MYTIEEFNTNNGELKSFIVKDYIKHIENSFYGLNYRIVDVSYDEKIAVIENGIRLYIYEEVLGGN